MTFDHIMAAVMIAGGAGGAWLLALGLADARRRALDRPDPRQGAEPDRPRD